MKVFDGYISVNWSEVSILEGLQIIQTVSNAKNDHAMATYTKFLVDLSKFKNGESIFYWLILEHLSDVIINRTNSKQRKKILEILTNLVQVIRIWGVKRDDELFDSGFFKNLFRLRNRIK